MTLSRQRQAEAAEMFRIDIADPANTATMAVLHEDGLYRHLAFRRPDTSLYWFDLVTWPGHLTFTGDMGCWTFRRTDDMIGFFATGLGINPGYWAEKCICGPTRAYDPDSLTEHVADAYRDYADSFGWPLTRTRSLWAEIQDRVLSQSDDEGAARAALRDFSFASSLTSTERIFFEFYDAWEWELHSFTHQFLWVLYAIRWGVNRYLGRVELRLLAEAAPSPRPEQLPPAGTVGPTEQTLTPNPDYL
jgi:hypothetical protein